MTMIKTIPLLLLATLVLVFVVVEQHVQAKPLHFPMKKVNFGENRQLQELYKFTSSYNRYKALVDPPTDLPLGGSISLLPTGAYFVEVAVGTPPQVVLALLDSGSNDFLVTTTQCVGCNKPASSEYDISSSSSVMKVTCETKNVTCPSCIGDVCGFFNEYITCAPNNPEQVCILKGPILNDVFSIPGQPDISVPVYFGAITFMNITFPGPISAIWGVASNKNYTEFHETGPLEALAEAGIINDMFSVCILQENGTFTLGGYDPAFFEGNLNWTPILSEEAFVVETTDISVNGVSLGFPSSIYNQQGGSVVDTGTYSLVVPSKVYHAVAKAMNATCPSSNLVGVCGYSREDSIFYSGKCFEMTDDQISAFPSIGVTFNGSPSFTVNVDGYGFLVPNVTNPGCLAWGLQDGGSKALTLHGDVVQKNKYLVFDKTNMALGWNDSPNIQACQQGHP